MIIDDHQRIPPNIIQSNQSSLANPSSGLVPLAPLATSQLITLTNPIPELDNVATIDKERVEVYSFQRSLDNKMDHLNSAIHKLVNSISGNTSSDQANKASSE